MENPNQFQPQQNFNTPQIPLPNGSAVLVLGIISIVGCLCYSVPGLICGIIALILAGKDMKLYQANPQAYTQGSFSNLKSGKICAIIGVSFSVLFSLILIFLLVTVGIAALNDPQHFFNQINR
jgi:hypothetical protein